MIRTLAVAVVLGTLATAAAWDVKCERSSGIECTDPYDNVRHSWDAHPRAEHRAFFQRTLELSGLPVDFQLPYELTVFSATNRLTARIREFPVVPDTGVIGEPVFATHQHESVAPVRRGATRRRVRAGSIPGMANLPDFSYTLWDWASGNEHCPPDPANFDAVDCHNYETHIGWLNSNHMLPQARKFLRTPAPAGARQGAAAASSVFDAIPALQLQRFAPYVRAVREDGARRSRRVAQHYLQDAWARGHMWERWGGPETARLRQRPCARIRRRRAYRPDPWRQGRVRRHLPVQSRQAVGRPDERAVRDGGVRRSGSGGHAPSGRG